MKLRTDMELFAAALAQARVDVFVGKTREITGILARITPVSINVRNSENSGESAYFWRDKCAVIVAEK